MLTWHDLVKDAQSVTGYNSGAFSAPMASIGASIHPELSGMLDRAASGAKRAMGSAARGVGRGMRGLGKKLDQMGSTLNRMWYYPFKPGDPRAHNIPGLPDLPRINPPNLWQILEARKRKAGK